MSMDKRSNVDSLAYKVEFHDESEDFYDEYIDIIYRNGNYRRLFVTGYSNGANLKAVAKEVYNGYIPGTVPVLWREQPIMAENQEMADNIVSGSCKCSGATIAKRQAILMQRINYIAAASHNDTFSPLSESEVRMLRQGGIDVLQGNCESVTFELMDSKVKIWNTGDKIKIKRTASREEAAEA